LKSPILGEPKQVEEDLSYSSFFNFHPTIVTIFDGNQNGFGRHLMARNESILFAIQWWQTNLVATNGSPSNEAE
jgi:hypothetical protein